MSRTRGLHVRNAPSPGLIFTYLGTGLLSFLFLGAWTAFSWGEWGGFYAGTRNLAWIHLAVLLWLNLIIFGVLFQFVPVVLNVRLGSEKLAWAQLVFYLPGAIGMTASFWIGRLDWPLHSYATILWIGFFLFIWNMLVTYRKVAAWTLTARCIYAAILYLLATIMLGLFLSIHLAYPLGNVSHLTILKIHAHFGIVGWLLMIVMGISQRLLPMFLLSHGYSTKPGEVAFYLINIGLPIWLLLVFLEASIALQSIAVVLLGAGIFSYLLQTVLIFRKRNKVKADALRQKSVRRMEFQLWFVAAALVALVVAVLLGIAVTALKNILPGDILNRLIVIYGAIVFLGFFSLLTQAILYKIIPYLVWLKKFSKVVGRIKAPRIDALVPKKSAIAQLSFYCAGSILAIAALGLEINFLRKIASIILCLNGLWLPFNFLIVWKRAVPTEPA